jgi:hypothetical protein
MSTVDERRVVGTLATPNSEDMADDKSLRATKYIKQQYNSKRV